MPKASMRCFERNGNLHEQRTVAWTVRVYKL